MTKRLVLLFSMALCIAMVLTPLKQTGALSGSDWLAGNIIDDYVFTDKSSMSVADVQAFLNSKVGTGGYDSVPGQCDTNGSRNAAPYNGSVSRAAYAASIGKLTKWTCLNNYYEVPKTTPGPGIPASNYGSSTIPSGAKSAAQLIWDAAQQYNISPKVLLTTIQKESAGPLTTDDWPWQTQYTYAMGAHCPDTAPCDPNYAGFSIQISESAALFRWYLDNMNQPWWPYKKVGVNNILYNPSTSCGSSSVNIVNSATAALYTYTPYQPNQAALDNLYGSAPPCGAYGNRNFWRIYNDWFGTTYGSTIGPSAYRLYNSKASDHFYTSRESDRFHAKQVGYKDDGTAFAVSPTQEPGMIPIYSLYNGRLNDHWMTPDGMNRYWGLIYGGYRDDGIAFYAYPPNTIGAGSACTMGVAVYALWHGGNTEHFLTTSNGDRYWALIYGGYLDDQSATYHDYFGYVPFCAL